MVLRCSGIKAYVILDTNYRYRAINVWHNYYLMNNTYVTPYHQMRHKSHTKILSKWLNKEK